MKRSRFSEEQIAYALRLAESGTPVVDVCRQLGVSEATYYTWKKKFGDLGVSELKSLESQLKALSRSTPKVEPVRKFLSPIEVPRGKPGRKVVFGAAEFLTLRQHLGFTQAQMGKLVGASSLSIYKWESGQVIPRVAQLEKIIAVRKIGKREALARVQDSRLCQERILASSRASPYVSDFLPP